MIRIHCIIHASFEQPGTIEAWARDNNYTLTYSHIYQNEDLPSVDEFDLLVSMGGPQSPLEKDKYPYLNTEVELIKAAIVNNKKIFGTCLGAQLIAEALGADTLRRACYKIN